MSLDGQSNEMPPLISDHTWRRRVQGAKKAKILHSELHIFYELRYLGMCVATSTQMPVAHKWPSV